VARIAGSGAPWLEALPARAVAVTVGGPTPPEHDPDPAPGAKVKDLPPELGFGRVVEGYAPADLPPQAFTVENPGARAVEGLKLNCGRADCDKFDITVSVRGRDSYAPGEAFDLPVSGTLDVSVTPKAGLPPREAPYVAALVLTTANPDTVSLLPAARKTGLGLTVATQESPAPNPPAPPLFPVGPPTGTSTPGPDAGAAASGVRASGLRASYAWTGKQIRPTPTISHSGKTLARNVDYTLSYGTNTKVGKGSVKVTGKTAFSGSKTFEFTILPKRPDKPTTTIRNNKLVTRWKRAASGQNVSSYQVRYRRRGTSRWTTRTYTVSRLKATLNGTKTNRLYQLQTRTVATITAGGKRTRYYSPWSSTLTTDLRVYGLKNHRWTGEAIKPKPRVVHKGRVLSPTRDYRASYARNKNAGTARIVIRGESARAEGLYITLTFKILKRS
jgi:hypothetical protein